MRLGPSAAALAAVAQPFCTFGLFSSHFHLIMKHSELKDFNVYAIAFDELA
jgi:hypothetical protein